MSEQIPQDPERQEAGGVEGAIEDIGVDATDSDDVDDGATPQRGPTQGVDR